MAAAVFLKSRLSLCDVLLLDNNMAARQKQLTAFFGHFFAASIIFSRHICARAPVRNISYIANHGNGDLINYIAKYN